VRVPGAVPTVATALVLTTLAGCGKKGPPLAPLRLVPAAAAELSARRSGDDVELRFVLPTANANGPGPIDLGSIEIFAITIGPGAVAPANRDLLTTPRVVGTIAVRPPPVEGEGSDAPAKPGAPPDTRPAPGDRVTFVDQLTAEKLKPIVLPSAGAKPGEVTPAPAVGTPDPAVPAITADPAKPVPGKTDPSKSDPSQGDPTKPDPSKPAPGAVATATPQPPPTGVALFPSRIYAIRGLARSGRPGPASTRIVLPLVPPVTPPAAVRVQMPTEAAAVIDWTAPVGEPGLPAFSFNVYRQDAPVTPLHPSPIAEPTFQVGGVEYGKEHCFVVRSVQRFESVTIEGVPSAPACLTPLDKFPPAAPVGLRAVAEEGAISLVWDQNGEADLGGYVVLRGEAPGETLAPITPQPIADANYRDTTVKPGVRYVYAVVAVDNATPRNTSGPSPREEATAR
jgi:predicted small lipoprotein YifL